MEKKPCNSKNTEPGRYIYEKENVYVEPYLRSLVSEEEKEQIMLMEEEDKAEESSIFSIVSAPQQEETCPCPGVEMPWEKVQLPSQGTYRLKVTKKPEPPPPPKEPQREPSAQSNLKEEGKREESKQSVKDLKREPSDQTHGSKLSQPSSKVSQGKQQAVDNQLPPIEENYDTNVPEAPEASEGARVLFEHTPEPEVTEAKAAASSQSAHEITGGETEQVAEETPQGVEETTPGVEETAPGAEETPQNAEQAADFDEAIPQAAEETPVAAEEIPPVVPEITEEETAAAADETPLSAEVTPHSAEEIADEETPQVADVPEESMMEELSPDIPHATKVNDDGTESEALYSKSVEYAEAPVQKKEASASLMKEISAAPKEASQVSVKKTQVQDSAHTLDEQVRSSSSSPSSSTLSSSSESELEFLFEQETTYVEPYMEDLFFEYNADEMTALLAPCDSKPEMPWEIILIPENIVIERVEKPQEGECTCSPDRPVTPVSNELELCLCEYSPLSSADKVNKQISEISSKPGDHGDVCDCAEKELCLCDKHEKPAEGTAFEEKKDIESVKLVVDEPPVEESVHVCASNAAQSTLKNEDLDGKSICTCDSNQKQTRDVVSLGSTKKSKEEIESRSKILSGTKVGSGSKIGSGTKVLSGIKVGSGMKVGSETKVRVEEKVESGMKILSGTRVASKTGSEKAKSNASISCAALETDPQEKIESTAKASVCTCDTFESISPKQSNTAEDKGSVCTCESVKSQKQTSVTQSLEQSISSKKVAIVTERAPSGTAQSPVQEDITQQSEIASTAPETVHPTQGGALSPNAEVEFDFEICLAEVDEKGAIIAKMPTGTQEAPFQKDFIVTIQTGTETRQIRAGAIPQLAETSSMALLVSTVNNENNEIEGLNISLKPSRTGTSKPPISAMKESALMNVVNPQDRPGTPNSEKVAVSTLDEKTSMASKNISQSEVHQSKVKLENTQNDNVSIGTSNAPKLNMSIGSVPASNAPKGNSSMSKVETGSAKVTNIQQCNAWKRSATCPVGTLEPGKYDFVKKETSSTPALDYYNETRLQCKCPKENKLDDSKFMCAALKKGQYKDDPVTAAIQAYQAEMKPLRDTLQTLREKIRDLNIPETNALMKPSLDGASGTTPRRKELPSVLMDMCTPCGTRLPPSSDRLRQLQSNIMATEFLPHPIMPQIPMAPQLGQQIGMGQQMNLGAQMNIYGPGPQSAVPGQWMGPFGSNCQCPTGPLYHSMSQNSSAYYGPGGQQAGGYSDYTTTYAQPFGYPPQSPNFQSDRSYGQGSSSNQIQRLDYTNSPYGLYQDYPQRPLSNIYSQTGSTAASTANSELCTCTAEKERIRKKLSSQKKREKSKSRSSSRSRTHKKKSGKSHRTRKEEKSRRSDRSEDADNLICPFMEALRTISSKEVSPTKSGRRHESKQAVTKKVSSKIEVKFRKKCKPNGSKENLVEKPQPQARLKYTYRISVSPTRTKKDSPVKYSQKTKISPVTKNNCDRRRSSGNISVKSSRTSTDNSERSSYEDSKSSVVKRRPV